MFIISCNLNIILYFIISSKLLKMYAIYNGETLSDLILFDQLSDDA
jgi:hypothetical protein